LRILTAATVGFIAARLMPSTTALGSLAALVVGGLSYVVALLVVRELGVEDLRAVLGVVGKRR
jgi:uncharacterized membrane protein YeaQ/YmgE (transglycosylase-associated protein family)